MAVKVLSKKDYSRKIKICFIKMNMLITNIIFFSANRSSDLAI